MPNASLNFSLESLKSKTVADESSSFRMRAFMIYDGVVLLFKDSMERDLGTKGYRILTPLTIIDARTNQKTKRSILFGRGGFTWPLRKFRSRNSEAASLKRRCSQRDLNTLTHR